MSDTDFDEQLTELRSSLDQVVALLRTHGETYWLSWAERCQRELDAHDATAFDHLLGAYGGMGGFDDLAIHGMNGHVVEPEREAAVNDRLERLRTAIWANATTLRHELR